MQVNPYIEPLLRNATELVNERPASPGELERCWLRWGLIPSPTPVRRPDLQFVSRFLTQWEQLIDASTESARVELLNAMLRRYTAPPSITDHDGSGWHLHFRDPEASFGETLAGATTAAAAQFLCARGMRRLGRCELPDCDRAFVDFSRPGRQRYCDAACANRGAVRRHRDRVHREQSPSRQVARRGQQLEMPPPLSTYSAVGVLRQGPGGAAESPAGTGHRGQDRREPRVMSPPVSRSEPMT